MATPVHAKRFVSVINAVTACIDKDSLSIDVPQAEVTTNCDAEQAFLQGKYGWKRDLSGPADFASGGLDATLFAMVTAGAVAVAVKPANASPSATNPNYTGNANLASMKLDFGNDAVRMSAGLQGTGALTRAVT